MSLSFDVQRNLAAVQRTVSRLERDGEPARAVTLARTFPATAGDLWDALTNPERIPRWFLPVSGQLEPGGRYQLEGNAGGVIAACRPGSWLELTWEFGEDLSWVEVRLDEVGAESVRLTLTHTQHLSDLWTEYGSGATGVGWELGLLGLAFHLAEAMDQPPDPAVFAASADGKAFIAGSSDGWGKAAVSAGTDPVRARAAARRTASFYTGEPAPPSG